MFSTSTIELSSKALRSNLRFIKKRMKKGVRLCSVIKGNAYGHGAKEFVQMAAAQGVNYFGVHSAEEAYELKCALESLPELFIMGAIEKEAIEWAIKEDIEFAVFDFERLQDTIHYAQKLKKKAKVHIEIETGMYRTGFENGHLIDLFHYLKKYSHLITFQGLFTHFAGAESQANYFRIAKQLNIFKQIKELFLSTGLNPIYHHTACSAVLLNYPEAIGNMVRVGILQYGFWPNIETHIRFCGESENNPDILRRIIRWRTKVIALKEARKGSFIGYGTSYLAHKNMKLAILPIGYSHGYSRNLSNLGSVLINGKFAPVVGTVNMNGITVDITHISNVEKGDEVIVIGKQKAKEITVNSFSEQTNQLNYELLTRLPSNIPRIIE